MNGAFIFELFYDMIKTVYYSETYRFSGVYRIQEKGIIPDVLGCCIAGGERSADSGNATFGNAYEGHPGHVPDLQ